MNIVSMFFLEFINLFIHFYSLVENITYILICLLYCSENYFHTLYCAYSKFIDLDQSTVLTLSVDTSEVWRHLRKCYCLLFFIIIYV